jgi:hypothetical protein
MSTSDIDTGQTAPATAPRPWMRGVYMIVLAILFAIAETVLLAVAVIQFAWMIVYRDRQPALASFGAALGAWLREVARYQSAQTEQRPFPWADWPKPE